MNKRNIKKKKRFSSPKDPRIERGTGNVEQLLKLLGFRKYDPDRLTANQIRDLWTQRIDRMMAERCRNNTLPSHDKRS